MRGILFFLSVLAARHFYIGLTNCCIVCRVRRAGLSFQAGPAVTVLFDVLSDGAGRGDQAEGDGLANTTVLLQQNHLGLRQYACLFSCIQFRSLLAERTAPAPGRITARKRQMVSLLAYVPHVQETGVAGSRNFTSSFPSCAVQSGTDFFF